jgi:hypothetical protein
VPVYTAPMRWAVLASLSLAAAGAAFAQQEREASETKLRIGRSATFHGTQTVPPARLRITLLAYVDPVHSRLYRPRTGTRFVAFKLRIANLTRHRWQGTLASWATLVGRGGRWYDVTTPGMAQPWTVKTPALNEGMTIEGKRAVVGYLGWVLPKKVKLRAFRYQLELGPDLAVWALPRR